MEASKPKNYDFIEKIVLLIVGFLLTGVVGTFISYYLKAKDTVNTYNITLIESERKTGKELFEEVISGMDARADYAQLTNDNHSTHKSGIDTQLWNKYTEQIARWNENRNRRASLIELYFGDKCLRLTEEIHAIFLDLNPNFRAMKIKSNTVLGQENRTRINSINGKIRTLSKMMIVAIQKDSVGRIIEWKNNKKGLFTTDF